MNFIILKLIVSYSLLVLYPWAGGKLSNIEQGVQSHLNPSFRYKEEGQKDGLKIHPENVLAKVLSEPDNWNLEVEGFSPAYYDEVREAIAINTIAQPTDQWAAASTSFERPSGIYTIRFTTLLESDGECSYIIRIGANKVMDFQNPRIYGKDIEEYTPHAEVVKNVAIEQGSRIQVEFLPHSNRLVPEGDGYGFARARWKSSIEFIPQKEK